jgi:lipoprotein-releasing system ATP-binding protein
VVYSERFTETQIMLPNSHGEPIVLECMDLCKTFTEGGGSKLEILRNVNLTVRAGEKIAIVGASGSGKSTLLHLLGGLDKPTSGQVIIEDKDVHQLSETERCHLRNRLLGFVYQFHHLLPEFTAQENVAMPALIRGSSPTQSMVQARLLLEKVGMIRRLDHKPSELSGGERQRAAVARAMTNEPRCILADEPTGNLDKNTAEQVMQVMLRLNKEYGTSLVVVTHDMSLASKMDRIYTIEDGRLMPK